MATPPTLTADKLPLTHREREGKSSDLFALYDANGDRFGGTLLQREAFMGMSTLTVQTTGTWSIGVRYRFPGDRKYAKPNSVRAKGTSPEQAMARLNELLAEAVQA